ncbi:hypothetical protein ACTU45_09805 [Streptomyces sp. 24-1644]|uniref:hypothetical protein n=1 Tax=Streptomyces sp. 24-1644 TaxID=3457315 RepID=UPI003FA6EEAA
MSGFAEIPSSVTTPDAVETRIGTLQFADRMTLRIAPYTPGGCRTSIGSFHQGKAPLAITPADPPAFTEGTGLVINTLPPNDYSYYELLNTLVQEQPAGSGGLEAGGAFREIGIAKGHEFNPDTRMRGLLEGSSSMTPPPAGRFRLGMTAHPAPSPRDRRGDPESGSRTSATAPSRWRSSRRRRERKR